MKKFVSEIKSKQKIKDYSIDLKISQLAFCRVRIEEKQIIK